MAQYTENLNLTLPESTDFVNIDDINDNMEVIDTALGNIGTAADTGGSATEGTVMGKLNTIISGSNEKLLKPSTEANRTITDGFGNGISISKDQNAYKDVQGAAKLMNCISFKKSGKVAIELAYTADSIITNNTSVKVGVFILDNNVSAESFIDKAVGTVVSDIGIDTSDCVGEYLSGRDSSTGEYPVTGTKTYSMTVKKGECYAPVIQYFIPSGAKSYTAAVTGFKLTSVKIYYEDAENVIYL